MPETTQNQTGNSKSELSELLARIDELRAELKVSDRLLEDRTKLLKEIPECEAHGNQCMPHALEWINKVKTLAKIVAG